MRFSILTPSYNQARFLEQAMRSVLEQGEDVEYIVLDGGSTDGSADIIRRHDSRLAFWRSEPDGGQTAALNAGAARVTGDLVGWINSDDYYLPGALGRVRERFCQADAPDVVFGNIVRVDENGRALREQRHDDFSLEALVRLGLDVKQQALFWRRELCSTVFPLDESLKFCMDVQLVARLGQAGARFARIPAFLGAFRLHGDSKTSTMQEVCDRERAAIVAGVMQANINNAVLKRAALLRCVRRIRFLARGESRYALLGGRLGISREARQLVAKAAAWQDAATASRERTP